MKTFNLDRKHVNAFQFWRIADHFFGNSIPSTRFSEKREHIKNAITKDFVTKKAFGFVKEVERVKNITDYDLKKNYMSKGIPVVMEGKANNWECVKKWSPDWLMQNYCDDKVSLFKDISPDSTSLHYNEEETTLRDILIAMRDEDSSKYSRFNRILYDHPELVDDFDWNWLHNLRNPFSSGKAFQVFIGGKGTRTPLHAAIDHNLFTQVYGNKHWYIYGPENSAIFDPPVTRTPYFQSMFDPDSPDFQTFPNAHYLQTWECELKAGDVLFNPPSWWHQVTNLNNSIGVGFRWFYLPENIKSSLTQTLLTLFATNPPIWVAAPSRTDFSKMFRYMNSRKS
jgi:hypothetical protein